MTDTQRTVRSFLTAALTAQPSRADYEQMGLPETAERALRAAVKIARQAAGPRKGGSWDSQTAQAVIDNDLTPDVAALIPHDWQPPVESPDELAAAVERG